MNSRAVVRFVTELVKCWHRKRATCLGLLVYALMRGRRLGLAEIGRYVPTATTTKHHIKAVDRFLGNERVDLPELWQALIELASQGQSRLYMLLDWSDLGRGFEVLRASVSYGGRSQPVAWATSRKGDYGRSRNLFESNLCKVVKSLLPEGVELVVLADRGFARASFLRALRRSGIHFVIRARKDVHLIDHRGHGPLRNRSIDRGQVRDLVNARYGDDARVPVRCVLTFGHGTARKRPKAPWYLLTDLGPERLTADQVISAYRKRMRIEHGFRDDKSLRFGFQLRSVHLTRLERYDRLFAIAAVAMLLLVHIGAWAERRELHRGYKANTDPRRTHSLFHLGQAFLDLLGLRSTRVRLFAHCFNPEV